MSKKHHYRISHRRQRAEDYVDKVNAQCDARHRETRRRIEEIEEARRARAEETW